MDVLNSTTAMRVNLASYDSNVAWYSDWWFWIGLVVFVPSAVSGFRSMGKEITETDWYSFRGQVKFFTESVLYYVGIDLVVLVFATRDFRLMLLILIAYMLFSNVVLTIIQCRTLSAVDELLAWNPPELEDRQESVPIGQPDLDEQSISLSARSFPKSKVAFEETVEAELEVKNAFVDLGTPLQEALVRFLAQTMLMYYYITSLVTESSEGEGAWLWWWSTLPIQLLMYLQMGDDFFSNADKYRCLFAATHWKQKEGLVENWKPTYRWQVLLRALLGFISNRLYIDMICYTIPLVLMKASGMDFIKDAFAVVFITTLDDKNDPETLILKRKRSSDMSKEGDCV